MKRLFDIAVSIVSLVVLFPLLLAIGLAVVLDSPGGPLFRQERIGRGNKPFVIHKFRTMHAATSARAALVTAAGDARVTRVGLVLRKYKLDELPQLFDVLVGEMSLVGPRPEVARYVAAYPEAAKQIVLSVRPGITDPAALQFLDEEAVLAKSGDPETAYLNQVLPQKVALYVRYVETRSFLGDIRILIDTIGAIVSRRSVG
jgi:lipopolysaccharide/colanic/teichoic acid biosynthesis glycosyltransferase